MTVTALTAWVIALGARVAYSVLRAMETESFEYSILHGPFIKHVTRYLFAALGPRDAVMCAPVALLARLSPTAALLVRTRFGDRETAELALAATYEYGHERFVAGDRVGDPQRGHSSAHRWPGVSGTRHLYGLRRLAIG